MLLTILVAVVCVALAGFYWFSTRNFNYWKKRNVPFEPPIPFFGNCKDSILMKKHYAQVAQKIYKNFPKEPYVGVYYGTEPALMIQDPEIVKLVTTKDFYYFNGREVSDFTHKEIITTNMFFTQGDRWKVLRQNLTPLFSSAKMRNMFHLIEERTHSLEQLLEVEYKNSEFTDIKNVMARFTIDCICGCAFGVDSNAMEKDHEKNAFANMAKVVLDPSYVRGAKLVARSTWPEIFYGLGFSTFPSKIHDFFNHLMENVFKGRNFEPTSRNDFVDLLLQLKKKNYIYGDSLSNITDSGNKKKIEMEVTSELLVAQTVLFFAAGFETSATTLVNTLYELAKQPHLQDRVLEEVDAYLKKCNNKIDYEVMTELPYMDACMDEALRLYPVLGVITREVAEQYTLPTGLVLEKGLRIHLPLFHTHMNPDFFPEPEKYIPERFFGDAKKNILPHTYMPFGEGPRVCIGLRFAKMQMLAGFVTLFKNYRVELADGMAKELTFMPTTLVTQPEGSIRLKLIKRS